MSATPTTVAADLKRRAAAGGGTALVAVARIRSVDLILGALDEPGAVFSRARGLITFPSGFRAKVVSVQSPKDASRFRGFAASAAWLSNDASLKGGRDVREALRAACVGSMGEVHLFEEGP